MLRLRSDEQLVALFREGHDEAFRVIHDRYRQRLFAYTRQMLRGSPQDAEDALQDVFVRAYSGLRANDRNLALRAWLYRVAHNRCIDELRRPAPPTPEVIELVHPPVRDPIVEAERRESLRRLIEDVRRLPDQQRSALLLRELSGMAYSELADTLGVSVPAIKSLLVRARVSLAQSMEARDTACSEIQDELTLAHDRGVRPNGTARRHLRDCVSCREFRGQVRGTSRQLAALVPALGPAGVLANLLGWGGSSGAAAGGGAAATVGGGGFVATAGLMTTGAGHIATLLAAAAVTAGGAIELQHSMASPPVKHQAHRAAGNTESVAEPTGVLAVAVRSAAAPALVDYATSLPAATHAPAVPTATAQAAAGPAHAGDHSASGPPSGGSATSAPGPNPNGGSSFDAETGVGPGFITGTVAPPTGSQPATGTGTGNGDSTSSTGSPSSTAGGSTTSTTGTSGATGSTTAGGPTTAGATSSPSVPLGAGAASAGTGSAGAGSPTGSGHSTAPQ